jgi:hypothetical protein
MKRCKATTVAALLLLSMSSLLVAQGRFPPKYELSQGDAASLLMMSGRFVVPLQVKTDIMKGVPRDFAGEGTYFQARLGEKDVLFALDGSKPPKLYVDTNRDGRLSDEKAFGVGSPKKGDQFEAIEGARVYGPVSVAAGEKGAETRLSIVALGASAIYVSQAGFMSGRVRLDGQDYRVVVADCNFDGHYDRTYGVPESAASVDVECETFAIGSDAEGKFDQRAAVGGPQPLPKMISVGKTCYSIQVAPDGSSIEMDKVEPKMGTLDIGKSGVELTLWSESGVHRLSGDAGTWDLPVGKYAVQNLVLRSEDKTGKWSLMGSPGRDKGVGFEIVGNKTTAVKFGQPLAVKTEMTVEGDTATFSLSVAGQGGEQYMAMPFRDNVPAKVTPKLVIYNELGKEIASGLFEHG